MEAEGFEELVKKLQNMVGSYSLDLKIYKRKVLSIFENVTKKYSKFV